MKKSLNFIMLIFCVFALSSCFYAPVIGGGGDSRTVTFVIDGVETAKTFSAGQRIVYPEVPEKDNYIFSGWYYDELGENPAYLGTSSSSSIKLYAVWSYDYESALSEIFKEEIKATVGIKVEHKKSSFGVVMGTHNVAGSGVIFKEDGAFYYILTNNHVTESLSGYVGMSIYVTDCYGNQHDAAIIGTAPEYDLSIIRIAKNQTTLAVLPFADNDAEVGDVVVAIGQPNGIDNSVTFGIMTKLEVLLGNDPDGNLGIPVIWHDAPMDHGSSGGVLMNGNFEIIGINYAIGTSKDDGSFLCGLAVPLDKVKEFVASYN